jgi:hypothetical protein
MIPDESHIMLDDADSRQTAGEAAGQPEVVAGSNTDAADTEAGALSANKKSSTRRPDWLHRPDWKESTWRLMRRGVLLATAVGSAGLIWYTGIVSPGTPPQQRRFLELLMTFAVIMVVLMMAAHMGRKPDESLATQGFPKSSILPADMNQLTTKVWQDLLTLEYQKGADRYENLYKAIWLNFSYAVAVGAAIITFGAAKLRIDVLQFVALCPILFWFVATFIPMNHYGELTRERLRDIENDLNAVFFRDRSGNPIRYSSGRLFGFQHFARFGSARALWRVGDVVHITGALIGLYWLWMLSCVMIDPGPPPRILPVVTESAARSQSATAGEAAPRQPPPVSSSGGKVNATTPNGQATKKRPDV